MNCDEARRHWNLYHDSEGDPELYFRINDHLGRCPACAEWFHQQSRLEELVTERLSAEPPTEQLWDGVLARSGVVRPSPLRRWLFFGGMALTMAASLLLAVVFWLGADGAGSPSLSEPAARQHQELADGARPVEFASRSDLEIERYLRQRVSFPVRCPPRKDTGFIVQGAGVSQLESEPAAYVFGELEGRPVSVFILSRDSLERFPHQLAAVRREGMHQCREGDSQMVMAEIDGNLVLVVGPVETDRLLKVLRAYGTYPHENHSS